MCVAVSYVQAYRFSFDKATVQFRFGTCATMMVHFPFMISCSVLTVGLSPLAVQHGSLALLVVAAPWAFGLAPEAAAVG